MRTIIIMMLFNMSLPVFGMVIPPVQYVSRYVPEGSVTASFKVPHGLERAVDFWIDVYAKYDTGEFIIHDSENHIIYEIVDVSDIQDMPVFTDAIKDEITDSRLIRVQKKYRDALLVIHRKKGDVEDMDPFYRNLAAKFSGIDGRNVFLNAARPGRIRAQRGQYSSFKQAMHYSRRYIPSMEEVFVKYGLPPELTRIPFVESYFNPRALSYRNASGIWQFMRNTGMEYLKIKPGYDERNDPVISTYAAAKMLKKSYKILQEWPLAVTGYNHGPFGMRRAVRTVGSRDLVTIIKKYRGSNFGFASKNFYAEFLAALHVEKNYRDFFGELEFAREHNCKLVEFVKEINIAQVESLLDVGRDELMYYNPALARDVFEGKIPVPRGARIRVPYNKFKRLLSRTEVVKNITEYVRFI
ncbi:MAG: lytic transglycosylase domain-containing protein [Oligoflexia bacterium]|nr:lytic transglycosylase domain-containing protein [Oligoflexia bacterium]